MSGRASTPIAAGLLVLVVAACSGARHTGVVVEVQLGSTGVDELRFGVSAQPNGQGAPERLLVDPLVNGRVRGPFPGTSIRQPIYLDAGGVDEVTCTVTGLVAGTAVASATGKTRVVTDEMAEIQLVLATAVTIAPGGGGGGGSVGPERPLGEACQADGECASGHCADGLCCDDACAGPCRSCVVASAPGRCLLIAAGVPDVRGLCPDLGAPTCMTDGTCDGLGACAFYAAGTVCAPRACQNKNHMLPAMTCDGLGTCAMPEPISCSQGMTCTDGACL